MSCSYLYEYVSLIHVRLYINVWIYQRLSNYFLSLYLSGQFKKRLLIQHRVDMFHIFIVICVMYAYRGNANEGSFMILLCLPQILNHFNFLFLSAKYRYSRRSCTDLIYCFVPFIYSHDRSVLRVQTSFNVLTMYQKNNIKIR